MDWLKEWWAAGVGAVTVIGWLFRLEGQIKLQAKEIEHLDKAREHDLNAAREARETTNNKLDEVQKDIKELLRKVGR